MVVVALKIFLGRIRYDCEVEIKGEMDIMMLEASKTECENGCKKKGSESFLEC